MGEINQRYFPRIRPIYSHNTFDIDGLSNTKKLCNIIMNLANEPVHQRWRSQHREVEHQGAKFEISPQGLLSLLSHDEINNIFCLWFASLL